MRRLAYLSVSTLRCGYNRILAIGSSAVGLGGRVCLALHTARSHVSAATLIKCNHRRLATMPELQVPWRERPWLLGNIKGAVTTAFHSHSTRQRLIGVKKDRSPPTPCHPPSPGVIPQASCPYSNKRSIHFFFHCVWHDLTKGAVTTASATLKGRGYNRASATFC